MHSLFTNNYSRGFSSLGTVIISTLFAAGGYGAVALNQDTNTSASYDSNQNAATVQTNASIHTEAEAAANAREDSYLGGTEQEDSPWLDSKADSEARSEENAAVNAESQTDTALHADAALGL